MRHLRALSIALLTLGLVACATTLPEPAAAPQPAASPEAGNTQAAASARTSEADKATTPVVEIKKSPNDDRQYRYLTLDNDLQVLLVSDPATDKAAASLVVFRGSYHDPDDYPGLAHFLEHMLFIGTAKYPEVDAYQAFISRHGGSSNAYTAGDHTNYFFDIQPEYFQPAMDRFAQFFISPLFAGEYVEREKNAVHSEYQLQIKADNWRSSAVVREVVNPNHPHSRFNIGSLETLGEGVREALLEFFANAYSADQMVLVAIAPESLSELESWVAPMFAQVENRRLGPAPVDEPLFLPSQLPKVLSHQTIKDGYRVSYTFAVPSIIEHYQQKPADYVSNLLGHEGEGSLYQRLQREGWIESLSAGAGSYDTRNSVLGVTIDLTRQGYDNLDQVTGLLFEYIELLRRNPPEAWRYQEQALIAELGFRFQEPTSATGFVYQVAPRFQQYPPAHVLAAPYLMTDFDPALIERYVAALTVDNLVMHVAGPDVPAERRERWFDVPYQVRQEPPLRSAPATVDLALPTRNPYLPEDLEVLPDDPALPSLAVVRPGLSLWSDRDTAFNTPRANLYLSLGIPDGISSAEDLAMATLYQRVVDDALSEVVYPAYLAGLSYRLNVDGYGFGLEISGYSDKQITLLKTVLDAVTDTEINPARFAVLRDELLRNWANYREERPYTQAYGALSYLLLSNRWPPEMLIDALRGRTAEELLEWREQRASRFHVLGLHHGNVPVESAWALASTLQERLDLGAFRREEPKVTDLSGARSYALDVDHQDAAMVLYLQDPDSSIPSRAKSALAASMLRQAYFSSLRTDQQLGYVVSVSNQVLRDRSGLAFVVQSPVASAAQLERATQEFLTRHLDEIAAMPDEAFASYQRGLIARLMERDQNLRQRGQRLWTNLDLGITSFDLREQIAQAVSELTKADMQAHLTRTAARFNDDRLLVYSNGRFAEAPDGGVELGSVSEFKAAAQPPARR
ncbi:MAG: insulinase family protein [Pseudomonadales bacterium]